MGGEFSQLRTSSNLPQKIYITKHPLFSSSLYLPTDPDVHAMLH